VTCEGTAIGASVGALLAADIAGVALAVIQAMTFAAFLDDRLPPRSGVDRCARGRSPRLPSCRQIAHNANLLGAQRTAEV